MPLPFAFTFQFRLIRCCRDKQSRGFFVDETSGRCQRLGAAVYRHHSPVANMWFTLLEGLHLVHLLHAICSGVEDLLMAAHEPPNGNDPAVTGFKTVPTMGNATLLYEWNTDRLQTNGTMFKVHPSLTELGTASCSAGGGIDTWADQLSCSSQWSGHCGAGQPAVAAHGSWVAAAQERSPLLGPLGQLVAVVIFEAAVSANVGGYSRGSASTALLGVIATGCVCVAGYQSFVLGSAHLDLQNSVDNLCLPLHLVLQILQDTAHGKNWCEEHFRRTGRRRRCSGERKKARSPKRESERAANGNGTTAQ